jgi:FtsP/CotA-like multicopper oxidase with cupredoxin domain
MSSSARTGFAEGDINVQFEVMQSSFTFLVLSTVLAGGTFPGPVITGSKGDQFLINVINALTDDTMVRTTSVVRPPHPYPIPVDLTQQKTTISTGMGYSRGSRIGPMVFLSSRNVP